jgi:predicted PurR-regulated permease PerM
LLFLVAVLLAVTLHPVVLWMERRRIARSVSVVIIAAFAIGLLAMFVLFLLPPLTAQMTHLVQEFPDLRARILARIPARYPAIQTVVGELFAWLSSPRAIVVLERSFAWGQSALSGLIAAAIVLVLTLYLLLDGRSLYAWLLAFVPRTHREKLAVTMDEVSDVIHAYVGGQLLAAVLFAIFTAALLTILGVPAAVPLAVIAGLCDVIPVLGILVATVPAVLLALVVSPGTAAVVALAYLVYHLFETYFLLPRIYGSKLKISTLSVLMALIVGGKLQGIIGAVLVLPLVAAYPIIERHWLGGYLRARVLTDHKALAKAAESGSEAAIDAVISGEKHASETRAGNTTLGASNR